MVDDARFEDARDKPLRLMAMDNDDLQVMSALVQDAVFPIAEMTWDRKRRRFALLLNRFRWEDLDASATRQRDYERVQSVLVIEDVTAVASQGVDRSEAELILSILSLSFETGKDGTGSVEITLAGDGAIAIAVEALQVTLNDVTRPYVAPSRNEPKHD
ncbi:MAG: DUF2948 family protein [Paracoccaceae bacterium]